MRLSLGKTVVFLSTILSLALLTGCSLGTAEMEKTDIDVLSEKNSRSWEQAETTPLGKYPELVTYTLGQMKGANNSNLPGANLYKVDVQRKTGTITTIGEAFITLGAEAEYLANPFSSQVLKNLADNLVNALRRSMEEVKQSANSRYYFVAADNEN